MPSFCRPLFHSLANTTLRLKLEVHATAIRHLSVASSLILFLAFDRSIEPTLCLSMATHDERMLKFVWLPPVVKVG